MATSRSNDYSVTTGDLLRDVALTLKTLASEGQAMTAVQRADYQRALNVMAAAWQKQGLHIWKQVTATLFPAVGQYKYELSAAGADRAVTSYFRTALSVDALAAATTIEVDDSSEIADTLNIGILLDDGSLFWTTVDGAPAGDVVTLADALPSDASETAVVFVYDDADRITRPIKIESARRQVISSSTEIPLTMLARRDYDDRPIKTQSGGSIYEAYYERLRATGYLYVIRAPDRITELVVMTANLPIEDFDNLTDEPDLPLEWYLALQFNLAVILAPRSALPRASVQQIIQLAGVYLAAVSGDDREEGSVYFAPDSG